MNISNNTELQNLAINYSADTDYKYFEKIYRECTKNRILFWQLILGYQQVILWDLEKNFFLLITMTVTDQLKIIDDNIYENQGQYALDRLAAKISAYCFGDLRKYEYLTGEDLGYKPSLVEWAKFDYSPLGNIFTKGLDKDNKEEGLFKRLENIKGKNEELLEVFRAANKLNKAAKNELF